MKQKIVEKRLAGNFVFLRRKLFAEKILAVEISYKLHLILLSISWNGFSTHLFDFTTRWNMRIIISYLWL